MVGTKQSCFHTKCIDKDYTLNISMSDAIVTAMKVSHTLPLTQLNNNFTIAVKLYHIPYDEFNVFIHVMEYDVNI